MTPGAGPARSARQRELGQNFLIDRNIVGVIARLASLSDADIVLEVGAGDGVLTERLAASCAFVHVVEVDERLRPGLARFEQRAAVALHWADAVSFDFAALSPPPGKMVANLPYGVAATVLLRTVALCPSLRSWVVMIQREVGERFAAAPGSAAYGVPSVLAQLSCAVRVLRPVARTVFRPVPNVDSVLLGLTRVAAAPAPEVVALVHGAFAHRRKALAGSLALAGFAGGSGAGGDVRDRAREALVALGFPADARAETLAPADFLALAEALR